MTVDAFPTLSACACDSEGAPEHVITFGHATLTVGEALVIEVDEGGAEFVMNPVMALELRDWLTEQFDET